MPIQHWSDKIWIAKLGDEPALSDDLTSLKEELKVADPKPNLVLDMSGINQLNSTNLSQLLRLRKQIIESDRKLKLAEPSDTTWAVFLSTGLDKVFEFTSSVPNALAELQMA